MKVIKQYENNEEVIRKLKKINESKIKNIEETYKVENKIYKFEIKNKRLSIKETTDKPQLKFESQADFINKLSVSLKEANETDYWLNLLKDSGYIDEKSFLSMEDDCGELIALLISSIKTVKNNIMKNKGF